MLVVAAALVMKMTLWTSSVFSVEKKLSARALSQQFARRRRERHGRRQTSGLADSAFQVDIGAQDLERDTAVEAYAA